MHTLLVQLREGDVVRVLQNFGQGPEVLATVVRLDVHKNCQVIDYRTLGCADAQHWAYLNAVTDLVRRAGQ